MPAARMSNILIAISLCFLLSPVSPLINAPGAPAMLQHLIFIIQENRSFDNYFGKYPGANGLNNAPPCCPSSLAGGALPMLVAPYHLDVTQPVMIAGDELRPGQMYPDANDILQLAPAGYDVPPFLLSTESTQVDINHSWRAAFTDWNYGKMNGFVVGERNNDTMGYYDRTDIPYYWDYANNFVLDDNFFSSEMGPSFPNHVYMASGSGGNGTLANPNGYGFIVNGTIIDNAPNCGVDVQFCADLSLNWATMAQELSQQGVSWKWYTGARNVTASTFWDPLPAFSYFQKNPSILRQSEVGAQNFINSVKNGTLPSVSWIIPGGTFSPPTGPFVKKPSLQDCGTSEHPPGRPDCGMDYVSYLVNSVMNSQYWDSTAIVITWDDYGGFYDHVAPPLTSGDGEGFRVPTLVISPYAKHGYIDHTPYEFSSFLSLVEATFGVPSLGFRDASGPGKNNMLKSFDFSQPPQPPLIEPSDFVGPATIPPLSNGYPAYGSSSSTSTSSSSSTTVSTSSRTTTTSSSSSVTSPSSSTYSTTTQRQSSNITATTTTSSGAVQAIPSYYYAIAAATVIVAASAFYLLLRRRQ